MVDNGEALYSDDTSSSDDDEGKPVSFWVSLFLGFLLLVSAGLNLLLIVVAVGAAGQFGSSGQQGGYSESTLQGEGNKKILVIPLKGIINDQSSGGLFGSKLSPVEKVEKHLERASEDKQIKGIILRVNSPGGGVTASDQIYHEIKQFQKKRSDVYFMSMMENVAASGGYYVSAPADYIMAHPTTVTGSIGVIMQFFVFDELLKEWNVKPVTITPDNADHKDMGSPFKPLGEKDRKIFKNVVTKMYERFLQVTNEGRENLSMQEVKTLADGRIYHAREAVENGLIDATGYFDQAVEHVKKKQNLSQARVVKYKEKRSLFDSFQAISSSSHSGRTLPALKKLFLGEAPPKFLYLWNARSKIRLSSE